MVDDGTDKLSDYLDCYWTHFHSMYPVIHRPTFDACVPAPFLAAAMVAIGAQFSKRPHSMSYSTLMFEACMKLLPTVSLQPPFSSGCGCALLVGRSLT